jgi:hypothetical protein
VATTDEEIAKAAAQNGGPTKRLSTDAVHVSDSIRDGAERQAGKRGPGRPKGSKTKTPEEAAREAKEKREKESAKKAAKDAYEPPSERDILMCRRVLEQGNKPLKALEGVIRLRAISYSVEPDLVCPEGDLTLSAGELDFAAECTAGSVALISPAIARYLPVLGLGVFSLSFLVGRGITLAKANAIFAEIEKKNAPPEKTEGTPENPKPAEGVKVT